MGDEMERDSGDRFDVAVIGAGQAGLAMGYFLAKEGRNFTILEASSSPGANVPTHKNARARVMGSDCLSGSALVPQLAALSPSKNGVSRLFFGLSTPSRCTRRSAMRAACQRSFSHARRPFAIR